MQPARGRFARFDLDRQIASTFPAHWKVGPAPVFWASQPLEPAEWLALLILKAGDVERVRTVYLCIQNRHSSQPTNILTYAPTSLRKVMNHNSSPWFESIRDKLFKARRERRQAERKWKSTTLTIFKDLCRQAKHKASKLVQRAKCQSYTDRIALATSSKELHQIVNALSNTHPPKINIFVVVVVVACTCINQCG